MTAFSAVSLHLVNVNFMWHFFIVRSVCERLSTVNGQRFGKTHQISPPKLRCADFERFYDRHKRLSYVEEVTEVKGFTCATILRLQDPSNTPKLLAVFIIFYCCYMIVCVNLIQVVNSTKKIHHWKHYIWDALQSVGLYLCLLNLAYLENYLWPSWWIQKMIYVPLEKRN